MSLSPRDIRCAVSRGGQRWSIRGGLKTSVGPPDFNVALDAVSTTS